eukprot:4533853-Amphidinium_carterae.1
MIEKDDRYASSSGEDTRRRKVKRDDKSWRTDAHVRRTNGWDLEWGPSSSCKNSEEKYVPCTIKLREASGFMKRDEEEGFFDRRDMVPVQRTTWIATNQQMPIQDTGTLKESGLRTKTVVLDLHHRMLVDQADGIPMANGSQAD